MRFKAAYPSEEVLRQTIMVARGLELADLVIKNARFLDVYSGEFIAGDIALSAAHIAATGGSYEGRRYLDGRGCVVVPGFIDTHVHIESSLMTPHHFASAVLPRGTTTAIWDPHEIANVKGKAGLEWALGVSAGLALDILLMLPSCVPSTDRFRNLETGAFCLSAAELACFKEHPRVLGLAEMMDYPSVLAGEKETLAKLSLFSRTKRDGHCPGLSGKELNAYAASGIHSCHESSELAEAREKLQKGMHVLIREGSCAKNARTLLPLLTAYSSAVLCFCSDDRNPVDMAADGHIDALIHQGLALGYRPEDLFRVASFAAARAYGLDDRGVVAPGFLADLCLIEPRGGESAWGDGFVIRQVLKEGKEVAAEMFAAYDDSPAAHQRYFPEGQRNIRLGEICEDWFKIAVPWGPAAEAAEHPEQVWARVIGLISNSLVTENRTLSLAVSCGEVGADLSRDILKISVIERHLESGRFASAFVQGFKLRCGAIASTIAHDCHNIIVVGVDAEAMAASVAYLREIDGGIVVWKNHNEKEHLALPLAGLMSFEPAALLAETVSSLIRLIKSMGCDIEQPFIQLSFLALPVIGALKITDRGLVDVEAGKIISVLI